MPVSPLTPADCDLRDFPRMMIDITRLRGSEFDSTPDDGAWRAGFNLWLTSWHQVPAASLSADDASLAKAAGLGRDLRSWKKVKTVALRGWVEGEDGRLYHPVVAEIALESWLEKLQQRLASGAGNAKRWGTEFNPATTTVAIVAAVGMLALINPQSKAIAKAVRKGLKPPLETVPPGSPEHPAGTGKSSHRDAETVPPGSQGTGTGKERKSSEDKSSAEIVALPDPDKLAWDVGVGLLMDRGGLTQAHAKSFFGRLISANGVEARDLLPAVTGAQVNQTRDPQSYLTKAAEGVGKRRAGTEPKRVGFV